MFLLSQIERKILFCSQELSECPVKLKVWDERRLKCSCLNQMLKTCRRRGSGILELSHQHSVVFREPTIRNILNTINTKQKLADAI